MAKRWQIMQEEARRAETERAKELEAKRAEARRPDEEEQQMSLFE